MADDKVIIDDVIGLLPQEHQGVVKLAVTLSETLIAKEQAQKKSQSCMNLVKNLLTYIAEESMLGKYNWKEFTVRYLKDDSFLESDSYENISKEYFKVVSKFKIPDSLAMSSLEPVLDTLINNLKTDCPDLYADAVKVSAVVFDEFEPEEISDDSEEPTD
jgi:hypothetical protein